MITPSTGTSPGQPLRILYLVPDLRDPAVARRVAMLKAGGAVVELAGFHRGAWTPTPGITPLGETNDADLGQRAYAVADRLLRPGLLARLARHRDVILARNLEMLVLARAARVFANVRTSLVYETLDIHGALLGTGVPHRMLRGTEGILLAGCDRLIVSSPAFVSEYFDRVHPRHPPAILVENRMLALEDFRCRPRTPRIAGRPWRIGWFGMIRCRQSLSLLGALTRALPGRIEVVVRGRPTKAVFPNFAAEVGALAGVRFEGPYTPTDLPANYAAVDFVWGMDFYEAGLNSSWLLPNRLYEGGAFDLPILAQSDVETARWLKRHGSGVVFDEPQADLTGFFSGLKEGAYTELCAAAAAVPRKALLCDVSDCRRLVDDLRP